jgi:hypothetical protein
MRVATTSMAGMTWMTGMTWMPGMVVARAS